MRCALLVAFVAILGCGKPAPVAPAPTPPVPVSTRREDDAAAAFQLDAAGASIEAAQAAARKLAPTAGGDAKEALLNVAAMLDAAGTSLADHGEAPPPSKAFREEERKQAVVDAQDALQALQDARDILLGLGTNVPEEFAKPLASIKADVDEAMNAVESGIEGLGGKVSPGGEP